MASAAAAAAARAARMRVAAKYEEQDTILERKLTFQETMKAKFKKLTVQIIGGNKMVKLAEEVNQRKGFVRTVLLGNYSWFVFTNSNPVRVQAKRLVNWLWFDRIVLFLIFANCIFLAMDDPTCKDECEKTNNIKIASEYAEFVFTALFTVELVCQSIAKGLVFCHGAYLSSPWNWLDFVIVVTSYQFLLPGGGSSVSGLRAFRALRPLRTITGVPGMRLLVNTLVESVPLMLDVLVLIMWVFGVFGIVGMEMFMGKLQKRCFESAEPGAPILKGWENTVCSGSNRCPTNTSVCLDTGKSPNNDYTSFDNFWRAFLAVFQTLTLQGWSTDLMYHVNDGSGHAVSSVYFVFLVMFGAFFALNLLTAIISAKFAQIHAEQAEEAKQEERREEERSRLRALRDPNSPSMKQEAMAKRSYMEKIGLGVLVKERRDPPWRPTFRKIVESDNFGNFITACILVNTLLMAMDHHPMEKAFEDSIEYINLVLSIIFFVEFVLKHLGMSLTEYWSNGFNAMDGVIVGAWLAELALGGGGASGLQALRTLRLLRVLRSMKLLRQFKELRRLMVLVIRGFIALKDFFLLLALFLFIFSVLGMQIFGGTRPFAEATGMLARKNFNNIWISCYTVFELLTGANWFSVMWLGMDVMGEAGAIYFLLWIICGNFVLLTLFLAILITNFQSAKDEEEEEEEAADEEDASEEKLAEPDIEEGKDSGDSAGGGAGSKAFSLTSVVNAARESERSESRERRSSGGFADRVLEVEHLAPDRFLAESKAISRWLVSIGWSYGITDEAYAEAMAHKDGEAIEQDNDLDTTLTHAGKEGYEEDFDTKESSASILFATAPASETEENITLGEASDGRVSPTTMAAASFLLMEDDERDGNYDSLPPDYFEQPRVSYIRRESSPPGEGLTPRERDLEELVLASEDVTTTTAKPKPKTVDIAVQHTGVNLTASQRASSRIPPRAGTRAPSVPLYDTDPPRRHIAARGGRANGGPSAELVLQKREDVAPGTLADGLQEYPVPNHEYINHLTLPTWEPSGVVVDPHAPPPNPAAGITQKEVLGRAVADVFRRRTLENVKLKIAADLSYGVDAVLPQDFLGDYRRGMRGSTGASVSSLALSTPTKTAAANGHSPSRDLITPYDREPAQLLLPYSGYHSYGKPRAENRVGTVAAASAAASTASRRRNQVFPSDAIAGPVMESYAGARCKSEMVDDHDPSTCTSSRKALAKSAFQRLLHKRRVHHTLEMVRRLGEVQRERALEGAGPGPVMEAVGGGGARAAAAAVAKKRRDQKKRESLADGEGEEEEKKKEEEDQTPAHMHHRALFCLSPENPVRMFFVRMVSSKLFEGVVLLLILFSSSLLAVDGPTVKDGSKLREFLNTCDTFFTIVFLIEMAVKILAMGFILHPGSYLRNGWNQLDFVIVASSVVTLVINDSSLSIMRTFRLMRVLRPLRMISRLKGMQIVINVLVRAMPACSSIIVFGLFEFGVFGILGVTLFKGGFSYCNDAVTKTGWTVRTKDECPVGEPFICTPLEGDVCAEVGAVETAEWKTHFLNFDNIGNAVMSLFVVATLDDWMRISYGCMDCRGIDAQPQININPFMGLYVIVFVFIGSFFWVNLLVGVIIDHYSQLISEEGNGVMLTPEQQRWQNVLKLKEVERQSKWAENAPKAVGWFSRVQRACFLLAFDPRFEFFIMTCILMNVMSMAIAFDGMSDDYKYGLEWLNKIFTIVFVVEFAVKVTALNFAKYIQDSWNQFDFLIVCISVPDLFTSGLPGASVFRIFRIGRMFKLVQSARGLRTLFNTLIASLPAIGNVGSLLFLLMFIYSVLGMSLYGKIEYDLGLAGVNRHANFYTFGASMMTLFRVFTGDSWSSTLEDVYNRGTGPKFIAPLFFISFTVAASLVMLNLIIAVILDQFLSEAGSEGLLQSNNFFDVLRKKMILDRFMLKVAIKGREFAANNPMEKANSFKRKSSFARVMTMFGRQSSD
ncbi:voltage-dependent calcium channel T type alpha-1H [Pycnococcus provasolii]